MPKLFDLPIAHERIYTDADQKFVADAIANAAEVELLRGKVAKLEAENAELRQRQEFPGGMVLAGAFHCVVSMNPGKHGMFALTIKSC